MHSQACVGDMGNTRLLSLLNDNVRSDLICRTGPGQKQDTGDRITLERDLTCKGPLQKPVLFTAWQRFAGGYQRKLLIVFTDWV